MNAKDIKSKFNLMKRKHSQVKKLPIAHIVLDSSPTSKQKFYNSSKKTNAENRNNTEASGSISKYSALFGDTKGTCNPVFEIITSDISGIRKLKQVLNEHNNKPIIILDATKIANTEQSAFAISDGDFGDSNKTLNEYSVETGNNECEYCKKILRTEEKLQVHKNSQHKEQMFLEMRNYIANCKYFESLNLDYEKFLRLPNSSWLIKNLTNEQKINQIEEKLTKKEVYNEVIKRVKT